MRIEIANKFIIGFIIVVGTIVVLEFLVPLLGVPTEWQRLVSAAGALTIGLVLGWAFSRAFTANIGVITAAAQRISKGDLSRPVELNRNLLPDETHDFAQSLNLVSANLRELVGRIRSSALQVSDSAQGLSASSQQMSASAHQVAGTTEQISRGAETQAEMVEKATQVIREMAASIEEVAASAQKVAAAANDTSLTAQHGGEMSRSALGHMQQVLGEVASNGDQILGFSALVQKIGNITEVITGIAEKTNLLALNATIEAARAGEYGRGFAVVAEEVSKLADSTGASAKEISDLIATIREEGARVQDSMRESLKRIDAGQKAIGTTTGAFEEIISTALNSQDRAVNIAELVALQTEGARHMVRIIEEIAKVTEDNAASTEQVSAATQEQSASMEEMAHAAQDLSALSEELIALVSRFRLGDEARRES
ncbi:methyl-accepting chemotaxis protein [Geoalkalibacter halelectricus]|uniref:Methyl-accepting chemotaxis protein n=1 Tax=Geoalkalibacter halelectricus TaxID=2847045 RepID=A0ABY5ZMG6_9BACT|nr:methyl-accepting chemotaxis protein [Geoalkalibacter halelectricus]MDO3378387.1 methyl-accepting chemotaxis protein [Geoalkalibacter halelectricus]UWZ80293.1 methyl-accepting chemotaxis protein [Geoalkalibacter halelectricus]